MENLAVIWDYILGALASVSDFLAETDWASIGAKITETIGVDTTTGAFSIVNELFALLDKFADFAVQIIDALAK